ncbi:MAG TPA: flavodoxin domain-containing protein [bacterium]|nr:flavodoxin domain-containing protein [bacterium]
MTLIIYYSKYGSTRDYAEWLAEATGAKLMPLAEAKKLDIAAYDTIAFGCPFYMFRLKIAGFVKSRAGQLKGKRVAFFAVGGAEPDNPQDRSGYENALPEEIRAGMRFFYLRGRMVVARMGFFDRTMMRMAKTADYDYTDRSTIAPLVEFLKGQ